jgi:hypothetical protein
VPPRRADYGRLHRNRWDLVVFVPFLAYLMLPGSFVLLPVVILRFPQLLPSVFQNDAMKVPWHPAVGRDPR